MNPSVQPTLVHPEMAAALRSVTQFADLTDEQIAWLTVHFECRDYQAGDTVVRQGSAADVMFVMLDGEIHGRADGGGSVYPWKKGSITGLLPESRMTTFPRTARAVAPSRIAFLHKSLFPEMLAVIPELGPRLLKVMADRIRDTTKADVLYEKLAALGKLSAGLAHELNNPAAAIARSVDFMTQNLQVLQSASRSLDDRCLTQEQRSILEGMEDAALTHAQTASSLDALTRSDTEEEIGKLLSDAGVPGAYQLAAELLDAGFSVSSIGNLTCCLGPEALPAAISRVTALAALHRLCDDVRHAAARISETVQAIKDYSYMDQAAEREIHVNESIESTLRILIHRLREVRVERLYDPSLPRIQANGGEINQVWTNLITNALDAMKGGNGVLTIESRRVGDGVLVEITDTGSGIPDEIKDHVFEPFFTTKPQGEGIGLGLDIVQRIVRKHHGDVRFDSSPGRTCFQVRLPFRSV